MKHHFYLLISILLISCKSKTSGYEKKTLNNNSISKEKILKHLANRNDSTTWNNELLQSDLSRNTKKNGPFEYGVFPVPSYNLIGEGSFTGLGNYGYTGAQGYFKKVKDKKILFNSFFVMKNTLNDIHIDEKENLIFFQIIVLTDYIDSQNFTHLGSEIISRNHPDYIGQGFYKTKNNKIDYVAFLTHDQNSYAIINTRIFDLKYGKTILIAPQKDKSLRSMQIMSPKLSSKEIDEYTDILLHKTEVIEFFTNKENI
ncbi:hypothetical protein IWQ47_004754 [Aquimarina sp. EL_43]|uniref:hypothetical protein n=1 Tax=Aquimarina TaxID=290174 RepID=UPI0004713F65|nr:MULTISPECIES: hypothetical protein [Aquimarina]MBG6133319.1 hypothetical protein [Aquimarina sp. EL_35]MBG6153502.1 hypothetical protein [Aquimarina sp. EL_32]MBG6171658.1 hypothetical protein [Aquimarina sp. EL_43]